MRSSKPSSLALSLACASLLACGGAAPPAASGPAAPAVAAPAPGAPAPAPDLATARIDAELAVARVARDAYVVTHEPFFESNVLVVRMGDGSLVICSSPFDTEGTRAMLRWLRATFRPPRIIAINTHFHIDGTGGNEAYAEDGVETYASDATQALLAARGEASRDKSAAGLSDPALGARVQRTRVVPAAHTFPEKDGMTLTIAGETVRVVHPGPGHTPDNLVVHFPRRDLLFGGCMIKSGDSIGFIGDAVLDRWEASVRAVEPLTARVVVPGHGPIGGPELLANTIRLVRAQRSGR
ncbi:MAG TPA: MBL fold metallo-hydrolase [Kofleriaceae bacterium]|nr:MBL fold metallo-hydrolase [Kofleriaceae bacterium]